MKQEDRRFGWFTRLSVENADSVDRRSVMLCCVGCPGLCADKSRADESEREYNPPDSENCHLIVLKEGLPFQGSYFAASAVGPLTGSNWS